MNVLSKKKFDDVCGQPSPCTSSRIIIAPITSPSLSQPLPDPTVIQLQSDVSTSRPPFTSDHNTNIPNSITPTPLPPSPSLSLPSQTVINLPLFRPVSDPHFKWKDLTGVVLINWCYSRATHWIPNLFTIPCGKQGKLFIKKLTCLFCLYSEDSAMECLTFKVAFVFPILVLQTPIVNRRLGIM